MFFILKINILLRFQPLSLLQKQKYMNAKTIFITGIGTDVGKTVIAAIFVEALRADYWKPVQAGNLDYTDSDKVKALISNDLSIIKTEAYRLQTPASPHLAAAIDGVNISKSALTPPQNPTRHLIVEGAGGLMVPLRSDYLWSDWLSENPLPVVVVSRNYLGSINHTLLTINALQQKKIPILGIVFNGVPNESTESVIEAQTGLPVLLRVSEEAIIDKKMILRYADILGTNLQKLNISLI